MEISPETKRWCWVTGDLRPFLRKWQLKCHKKMEMCEARGDKMFVICAAGGLGKSIYLLNLAVMYAIKHPGSYIFFGAPVRRNLAKYIRPVRDVVFKDCPPGMYQYAQDEFHFSNGSIIALYGLNNKSHDHVRGDKYNLVLIDEGAYIDDLEYVIKSVIKARAEKGDATIIISSTPSNPAHDFETICVKAEEGGYYFHADIYDGEYSPEKIEKIKEDVGEESTAWHIEFLAERGLIEANRAITPEFTKAHVGEVQEHPNAKYFQWYEFLDQGSVDSTACVFAYWHPVLNKLVVSGELVVPGAEVLPEPFAASVKELEATLKVKDPNRLCDISEGIFTRQLSLLGLTFTKSPTKDLQGSVKSFRQMLKKCEFIVSPKCKTLIACLEAGTWDKNRKGFTRTKELSHVDVLAATIQLAINVSKGNNIPEGINKETGEKIKPKLPKYNPLADFLVEKESTEKDWKQDVGLIPSSRHL